MSIRKSKRVDCAEVLRKLQAQVPAIRAGKARGQIRYPADFKAAVVGIIQSGTKIGLISQTLGISSQSLRQWIDASVNTAGIQEQGVRELRLVPEHSAWNQEQMKIRFGEKIWIELPISALGGDLLRDLAMVGAL